MARGRRRPMGSSRRNRHNSRNQPLPASQASNLFNDSDSSDHAASGSDLAAAAHNPSSKFVTRHSPVNGSFSSGSASDSKNTCKSAKKTECQQPAEQTTEKLRPTKLYIAHANFLTQLPVDVIYDRIFPAIDNLTDMLQFFTAIADDAFLGPAYNRWLTTSKAGRDHFRKVLRNTVPLKLLEAVHRLRPIICDHVGRSSLKAISYHIALMTAGMVMDVLFSCDTYASEIFERDVCTEGEKQTAPSREIERYYIGTQDSRKCAKVRGKPMLGIYHHDMPITQKILARYFWEVPEKMAVFYLTDIKQLLPDIYHLPLDPVADYFKEFKSHTTEGHRRLVVIGAFSLCVIYTFAASYLRVRCTSFASTAPTMVELPDGKKVASPSLPVEIDMSSEDQYMSSELWQQYAQFDQLDFWDKICTHSSISTKTLIANSLCTRMDLGSAIYHSKTTFIELFGLDEMSAFDTQTKTQQFDWRFVGYSIMANAESIEGARKILLSSKGFWYDDAWGGERRLNPENKKAKYSVTPPKKMAKIVNEFDYSETVEEIYLFHIGVSDNQIDNLLDCNGVIKKVTTLNGKRRATYNKKTKHDYGPDEMLNHSFLFVQK